MNEIYISIIVSVFVIVILFLIYYIIVFYKQKTEVNELETERNNYKTISQQANDMILTIDIITGEIYNANDKVQKMLGYNFHEILNKTIYDIHPSDLLTLSSKTIAEVWDKKGLVYENLPFKTSKNELIDVECSAKILVYNNKPAIVIYARDIRERLKLRRQIIKTNDELAEKNKNITDSIKYASRIQNAILGSKDSIKKLFPESFVFMKPHSIVSGDFFWFKKIHNYKIIIAADCTGHGVPGAFMTVLGHDFLEEIISEKQIVMPNEILSELNKKITARLSSEQTEETVQDGMDLAMLVFDTDNYKAYFSGAKNPLVYFFNDKINVIKGSNSTIGGKFGEKQYDLHKIETKPNMIFYMYSDGFQDQFGGETNRKYMSKNFRSFLHSISHLPLDEQKNKLNTEFENWKTNKNQTDDVLVIGIKI